MKYVSRNAFPFFIANTLCLWWGRIALQELSFQSFNSGIDPMTSAAVISSGGMTIDQKKTSLENT